MPSCSKYVRKPRAQNRKIAAADNSRCQGAVLPLILIFTSIRDIRQFDRLPVRPSTNPSHSLTSTLPLLIVSRTLHFPHDLLPLSLFVCILVRHPAIISSVNPDYPYSDVLSSICPFVYQSLHAFAFSLQTSSVLSSVVSSVDPSDRPFVIPFVRQ